MSDLPRPTVCRGVGQSRLQSKAVQHGPSSGISATILAQHTQKRRIWGVLSALGELFRAYTTKHRRRATNIAHSTQKHGDIETNNTTAHPQQGTTKTAITSAPKKCTKNAHFPPAKTMAVSIPHRHQQAKATMVSNHRATSPAAPTRGTRGRRRGLAGQQADVPGHTSAHQSPLAWRAPEHQRRNKQPPRT